MKTKWFSPVQGSMLPLILLSFLVFASYGCEDNTTGSSSDRPIIDREANLDGNVFSEQYWVQPEGTIIGAINGTLRMDFPRGAVNEPTLITVASFPLDHLDLDGYKMLNRGYRIEASPMVEQFNKSAKLWLQFDINEVKTGKRASFDKDNMTLFQVWDNLQAYEKIEVVEGCCINSACDMVYACICECGFYVVGENK